MDTAAEADSSTAKVAKVNICPRFFDLAVFQKSSNHVYCFQDDEDYDIMQDPEFLQSVLENLPGVDPNNDAIRNAMGSLASQTGNKPDNQKKDEKEK